MCPDSRSETWYSCALLQKASITGKWSGLSGSQVHSKIHRKACYGVLPTTYSAMRKYQNEIAIGKCLLSKQLRKALDVFSFFLRSKQWQQNGMKDERKSKLNTVWAMSLCCCGLLYLKWKVYWAFDESENEVELWHVDQKTGGKKSTKQHLGDMRVFTSLWSCRNSFERLLMLMDIKPCLSYNTIFSFSTHTWVLCALKSQARRIDVCASPPFFPKPREQDPCPLSPSSTLEEAWSNSTFAMSKMCSSARAS